MRLGHITSQCLVRASRIRGVRYICTKGISKTVRHLSTSAYYLRHHKYSPIIQQFRDAEKRVLKTRIIFQPLRRPISRLLQHNLMPHHQELRIEVSTANSRPYHLSSIQSLKATATSRTNTPGPYARNCQCSRVLEGSK